MARPREKRQKLPSQSDDSDDRDSADGDNAQRLRPLKLFGGSGPDPNSLLCPDPDRSQCPKLCCRKGEQWMSHHLALDDYHNGPTPERLNSMGGWDGVKGGVAAVAMEIQALGLVPWDALSPSIQERLSQWSPVARQLWDSEFAAHREAMVRAWVWHYLDDNLFSFTPDATAGTLVKCSSPVWEHVRTLRRELDILRTRHDPYREDVYFRIQLQALSRMIEHLVRRGLGLEAFATAPVMVAHFKESLRQLLVDGKNKLPDLSTDSDWYSWGDLNNRDDQRGKMIKRFLEEALALQYFLHGLTPVSGVYTLRFSPVGSDNLWGFAMDKEWMYEDGVPWEIPGPPPGQPRPTIVQLVSDPMMVISGRDGTSYGYTLSLHTPMRVVVPWTFGGKEIDEMVWPGFRERFRQDRLKQAALRAATGTERAEGARLEDQGEGKEEGRKEEDRKEEDWNEEDRDEEDRGEGDSDEDKEGDDDDDDDDDDDETRAN